MLVDNNKIMTKNTNKIKTQDKEICYSKIYDNVIVKIMTLL